MLLGMDYKCPESYAVQQNLIHGKWNLPWLVCTWLKRENKRRHNNTVLSAIPLANYRYPPIDTGGLRPKGVCTIVSVQILFVSLRQVASEL